MAFGIVAVIFLLFMGACSLVTFVTQPSTSEPAYRMIPVPFIVLGFGGAFVLGYLIWRNPR